MGAYELQVLRIGMDPITVNIDEDDNPYDNIINLTLLGQIEGGFGELTFTINQKPQNFGSHCGPEFAGQRGVILFGSESVVYCSPRDFYNVGIADGNASVQFTYTVTDETGPGSAQTGTVNILVNPTNDADDFDFGTGGLAIGDENPPEDIFEIVGNAGIDITFRLRPYVTFGNFFFSERNNPEGGANGISRQVQYPYTYGDLNLESSSGALVFPDPLTPAADGLVTLDLDGNNAKGQATYSYTVNGVTNYVRIKVVSIIPNQGLHDDTSLVFNYDGVWSPLYSETNINNTLHQTARIGDTAEFQFVGAGFILYMQGDGAGGNWRLEINGTPVTWGPGINPGESVGTSGGATCVTRAATGVPIGTAAPNPTHISNRTRDAYTVSCSDLASTDVHTVAIVNRESKRLNIDAFAILEDTAASPPLLGPGFHPIDELEIVEMFGAEFDWAEISERGPFGGRAMATLPAVNLTNGGLTFSFKGGTGFAIGTSLEKKVAANPNGAQYSICVEEQGAPATEVCQDFDNGLGGTGASKWQTYRPFFGFDPGKTYDVTIDLTNIPAGERLTLDSIVVFQDKIDGALPFGETEDDQRNMFLFGNGLDDAWIYDTTNRRASAESLTSLAPRVIAAGPFISFNVPETTDTIMWQRFAGPRDSREVLVCVDRAVGMGGEAGNCIKVNLAPKVGELSYYQQDADGSFIDGVENIQIVSGVVIIKESLFRAPWAAAGPHTVEIFSLTNEAFGFDKVTVLDSTAALTPGYYEETTGNISYWECDAPDCATYTQFAPVPYDRILNNFTAPFTQASNRDPNATRASGGGYVLSPVDESKDGLHGESSAIRFEFTGTGFSAYFTLDRSASTLEICWLEGAGHTVTDVLNTGDCQWFDYNSTRVEYQAARTLLGFRAFDDTQTPIYHTVVIRMLDNTNHNVTYLPINMQFDALRIYGDDWTSLTPLSALNMRYETSYDNRIEMNQFIYVGSGWRSVSGRAAVRYSGENYDTIMRAVGAGLVFRTENANALLLYRDTRRGYSMLQICAAPYNTTTFAVDYAQQRCTMIDNGGGTGNQQPFGFRFGGAVGPYVVSITTLDSGAFTPDAIELLDVTNPLTAGLYEEAHPGLNYDTSYQDLLVNGEMERDSDWAAIGGLPAPNNLQGTLRYLGRFGRTVTATADGQGIESQPFDLTAGQNYTIIAHVNVANGSVGGVRMQLVDNGGVLIGGFETMPPVGVFGRWHILRLDVSGVTELGAKLRFLADGGAATFSVDTVMVLTGGKWVPIHNNRYSDGRMMESLVAGSQMGFTFTGTGFEIGTMADSAGGEVEICYTRIAPSADGPHCFIYQNEARSANMTTSRTVTGLTDGTYDVTVRDVEDGTTVLTRLPTDPRNSRFDPARVRVDYVRIFDDAQPPLVPEGLYNENAIDTNGDRYLQLLPAHRWGNTTGRLALRYSGESYTSIIDDNGRASRAHAGPVGVMTVNQNATVILYTDRPVASNSDQLLVCAGPAATIGSTVEGALAWDGTTTTLVLPNNNCALLEAFRTSAQVVINKFNLPQLGNAGPHTLSFRTLTPSPLLIDHYQVIYGTTLGEGYYEDFVDSDPTSTNIFSKTAGIWTTEKRPQHSGGSTLVSETPGAQLEFSFTGTGFSWVTFFDATGGTVDVQITQTSGGSFDETYQVSTNNTTIYQAAHTFAGLEDGTYDVTITNVSAAKLYLDAIQVYGTLNTLGSLYDDSEVTAAGDLILTYGPNNNSWTAEAGTRARGFLNETYHVTRNYGAAVSFATGDISGIIVNYGTKSTSTVARVCWVRTDVNPAVRDCTITLNPSDKNPQPIGIPVGVQGGTAYQVSIVNEDNGKFLYIDSIQIIENGPLAEGIYNAAYLSSIGAFTGAWTDAGVPAGTLKSGGANASLTFQFTGVGFSIVLHESSTTSSATYTLCVDKGGGQQCDIIFGASAADELDLNNMAPVSASKPYALTYMGLHTAGGDNDTYTVTLTNTDPAKPLLVERVEIFGADTDGPDAGTIPDLKILDTARYENNDPQIQYFPFGSLLEQTFRRNETSGNSRHIGDLRGAAIYFEFIGYGFEYFREISTAYGTVEICFGPIANTSVGLADRHCANYNNNTGRAYQTPLMIDPPNLPGSFDCTAGLGCWASIRSLDDKRMPVDFIRLFDPSQPLEGGFYEAETHPSMQFFDAALADVPTPMVEVTTPTGAISLLRDLRASNGQVIAQTEIGSGLRFRFHGTGFAVLFTQDRYADQVRICWLAGDNTTANVLTNGTCQVFDNESRANINMAARVISGLHEADYTAVVQMLDDNFTPSTHVAATVLPITMKIDAVQVFDGLWFTSGDWSNSEHLRALVPGSRYETSYDNAAVDKNFIYFGDGWRSVSGPAASRYSGANYDTILRTVGAGIMFRTDSADAMILYRDTRARYAPLLICATPVTGATTVNFANRRCTIAYNDGGTGNQQPFGFLFNTTGSTGPHVVTIHALDDGTVTLDAVEVVNTDDYDGVNATPRVLGPGLYEEYNPALVYDRYYENLAVNGDMERDGDWTEIGGLLPANNTQFTTRYSGTRSRRVVASASGEGIQGADFDIVTGRTYTIIARVYLVSDGIVRMRDSLGNFSVNTDISLVKKWQTVRATFTAGGNNTDQVQFVAVGGGAEFYVDDVSISTGGQWKPIHNTRYSDGRMMESQNHGAAMTFAFTGTGFEVGTLVDRDGGEVEICYVAGAVFTEIGANCFTYQHEARVANFTTSRTVAGLPDATYAVRVRDVENGFTTSTRSSLDIRNVRSSLGKVRIDYVRIFDGLPPVTSAGFYNENAVDDNGEAFLQLLPANRWLNISGRLASRYSSLSYSTIVDDNGRASRTFAGPVAVLQVDVPTAEGITVLLYTGTGSRANSSELLICADNVTGQLEWDGTTTTLTNTTDCILTDAMTTSNQIALSAATLPALGVPGTHTLTFRTLSAGSFVIDNFQVIEGAILAPGIYDEFLPDTLLNFTPDFNTDLRFCAQASEWCNTKAPRNYGGFVARTQQPNATLTFNLHGTGFAIFTNADARGVDIRICYKRAANADDFPELGDEEPDPELAGSGIWCDKLTTNTTPARWDARNLGRINPRTGYQYGFAYYGLPMDDYTVEIRVDNSDNAITTAQYLQIDAIAVFDDVTTRPAITPGLYDDADADILYGPQPFWSDTTNYRMGPPRGAWQLTEHTATNAGSVAQMYITGNALTLYQTADTRNSADVRICLVITDAVIHCSDKGEERRANQTSSFSQNGRRTYFTPIVFYGLGDDEHQVIFENRDHGRSFSIDAIRPWN